MTRKTLIDVPGTLEKLSSLDPSQRYAGWTTVHEHSTEFHRTLNSSHMTVLHKFAQAEDDPVVAAIAKKAMRALARAAGGAPAQPTKGGPQPPLPDAAATHPGSCLPSWLWHPFRERSLVLGVTAANYRRRDEGALICVGRRLGYEKWERTEIRQVPLEAPAIERLLFVNRYSAYAFVGRLGLFGKTAPDLLGRDDLRFGFELQHRPPDHPVGKLHPKYHSVVDRIKKPGKGKTYKTEERNGIRTDFAFVQRYMVELGPTPVTVVSIAGASSLGTLAAAEWAAYHLFKLTEPASTRPIEIPVSTTANSRMEALLSVKAEVTTRAWEHAEIKLLELYLDNRVWSSATWKWEILPVEVITVLRKKGKAVQIVFDGQPSPLEPSGQAFRLVVAMVEQQMKYGKIDIAALAANKWIWGGTERDEDHVRRRLSELKARYLGGALNIRGTLELRAKVRQRTA